MATIWSSLSNVTHPNAGSVYMYCNPHLQHLNVYPLVHYTYCGSCIGEPVLWGLYCGACIVGRVLWGLYCEACIVWRVLWGLYCGACIVGPVLWGLYCGACFMGPLLWGMYCGACFMGPVSWACFELSFYVHVLSARYHIHVCVIYSSPYMVLRVKKAFRIGWPRVGECLVIWVPGTLVPRISRFNHFFYLHDTLT